MQGFAPLPAAEALAAIISALSAALAQPRHDGQSDAEQTRLIDTKMRVSPDEPPHPWTSTDRPLAMWERLLLFPIFIGVLVPLAVVRVLLIALTAMFTVRAAVAFFVCHTFFLHARAPLSSPHNLSFLPRRS